MAQFEITAINSVNQAKIHAIHDAETEEQAIEDFSNLHKDISFSELEISANEITEKPTGLVIKHVDSKPKITKDNPLEVYGDNVIERLAHLSRSVTRIIVLKGAIIGFLVGWYLDTLFAQADEPTSFFYRVGATVLGAALGATGAKTCVLFLDWMRAILQNLQQQNRQ